jgi:hypothetical protein
MSYVLAKTASGALLTFNTKAQTGRNSELFCELVRVQQPAVAPADSPQLFGSQIPSTLVSLRGALIGSSGCSLSVINTTDIKKSRFVSDALLIPPLHPPPSSLSFLFQGTQVVAINTFPDESCDSHGTPTPSPSDAALVPYSHTISPLWLDIAPRYQR